MVSVAPAPAPVGDCRDANVHEPTNSSGAVSQNVIVLENIISLTGICSDVRPPPNVPPTLEAAKNMTNGARPQDADAETEPIDLVGDGGRDTEMEKDVG